MFTYSKTATFTHSSNNITHHDKHIINYTHRNNKPYGNFKLTTFLIQGCYILENTMYLQCYLPSFNLFTWL